MIAHLLIDEQNPAYDLLFNFYEYLKNMTNIINEKRINQITTFLKSLKIKSNRFSEIIRRQNILILKNFDQALIHSSDNNIRNYEKLEFFGDAVLRLAASNFIEKKYPQMSVGESSELRAQIVSDEWLTKLGKQIDIEKLIIKGPKSLNDENSKETPDKAPIAANIFNYSNNRRLFGYGYHDTDRARYIWQYRNR